MLRKINRRIRHGANTFFLLISEALMQNSNYAELKPFFLSTLLSRIKLCSEIWLLSF